MSEFLKISVKNNIGFLLLDRPKALHALSLEVVRGLTQALLKWADDATIKAVVIRSTGEKAFCAGGDIRFLYEAAKATPSGGSALLEDFFTEEYALNHLIHYFPKPYIALMDGIVMGGGLGITQGKASLRVVTERTKMAMPEVGIGLFPDVGGSYFLSRLPGELGTYLGVTGETINGYDALYAGLADLFIPSSKLPDLVTMLETKGDADVRSTVSAFAAPYSRSAELTRQSMLAHHRLSIDTHFCKSSMNAIIDSLEGADSAFALRTLEMIRKRSPLMMCVTLAQIQRGTNMSVAECFQMERSMIRRVFEYQEVVEGIRAAVIDKDHAPNWLHGTVGQVPPEMIDRFFEPAWPAYAHPLRTLK